MKQKNFQFIRLKFLLPLLLLSGTAYAGIASVDNTFVANDQYASDFTTKLNRNFQQLEGAGINKIESANIEDATITAADMADESSTVIRTKEGAVCSNFVYTGLLPQTTTGTLTGDITAGTGYPLGVRIKKNANTSHTWTASKWTWTDIDTNGDFHYTETAFGAAEPAVYANSMRLALVSSDATEVNYVLDKRVTNCSTGPFSIIGDATGESTLSDLLKYGNGGYGKGLTLQSNDATTLYINPGSAYINGEYRTLTSQLSVPINSVGSSTAGTSGLDAGTVAASTTYYLYGTADLGSVTPLTGILSTNATTPTGPTNFRKLGELTTDASSSIASADVVSIAYEGKIVQIKKLQTGEVATGTTIMPLDDTIPQNTEGDAYLTLPFTAVNASDALRIDVVLNVCHSAGSPQVGLFMGTNPNAIASTMGRPAGVQQLSNLKITAFVPIIGTTAAQNFVVRAGGSAGGTMTMNGETATRYFGGTLISSITITEIRK